MNDFDASSYMKVAKRYPLLSREKEAELAKRIAKGDDKAKELLVNSNLRFVIKLAHQYKTYCRGKSGITFDDIVQAGLEGLVKAAERFDHTQGFKFITYAVFWIKSHIKAFVRDNFSSFKIGSSGPSRALFFRQREINALAEIADADAREAHRADIAARAKVKVSDVRNMEARLASRELSIHGSSSRAEDSLTLEEVIGTDSDVDNSIYVKQVKAMVRQAMLSADLTDREKLVLRQRFFENVTLQEIADEHKLSRERIRQIEALALDKLKGGLTDMGLSQHDIS